ncbi:heavy metal translocating P-type ATPase [Hyperthermus butylicus]|uniref:heavy metal translocating P-type ATPase n=1 Tax=Hyperthermus butylicus TaxID=54248 RepID=UPI002260D625|nr:heavy metal translocating P-type ATPase [Hyperthermus butylicus]
MVIRNIESIEKATKLTMVVFDKTGTLTIGRPEVVEIITYNLPRDEVLALAAAAEKRSEHPIARSILEAARKAGIEPPEPEDFTAILGQGVVAIISGRTVAVGNEKLMKGFEVNIVQAEKDVEKLREMGSTIVYVAVDGKLAGIVAVADKPRPHTREVVETLRRMGLRVAMLTGDNKVTAYAVAKQLGIDNVIAEANPEDKVDKIRELQRRGEVVAMIGDGINDAASLVQADVGIAMGRGTDIAKEAGDIILVRNDLRGVLVAIRAAKGIYKLIKLNLLWAFLYNVTLIPIAAGVLYTSYGIMLRPEFAAAAMALSSISVTLNTLLLGRGLVR